MVLSIKSDEANELANEADADMFRSAIERAETLRVGAPTLLECEIVVRMASPSSMSTSP